MKTYKKLSILMAVVIVLSMVMVGGAAAKEGDKVDVCHKEGNGSFHLININADALDAHLAHGDGVPGQGFAADCSVNSTPQNEPAPPPATNNGNNAGKVDVCHRTGNGRFILINVSSNAVPAHLAHGDALPNGEVPNQLGMHFNATCAVSKATEKVLVQTLTVDSKGAIVNSNALEAGHHYEITVSGTYYFRTNGDWADAEYYFESGVGPQKGDDTEYPYGLDMCINTCPPNIDWGSYQESHVYTIQLTGTGAPLSFFIFDTVVGDNSGSLKVEIWKLD